MDIALLTDIVKDERGNYYVAVHKDENALTLVNALLERSYRTVLSFDDDFRRKFAEYEGRYLGAVAADALRHDIVFASSGAGRGRVVPLADVEAAYRVEFIDTIEFYRHPRAVLP